MADPTIEAYGFADDGRIPNNPHLSLILYRGVLKPDGDLARAFEERFAANGWTGAWRNGVYRYHHYHSKAHEVLGIAGGSAQLRLGGEQGRLIEVAEGDAIAIPAGVGHKNEGASADFLVVGAYAQGRDWDLLRGHASERPKALENIASVPLPDADPLHGPDGPLMQHWRS